MKDTKLIIGKIPYANLFPVYYYLEKKCNRQEYKFVKGVPSSLNKMLRNDKIDISPSSSIEYLRHKDRYSLIPWLSVSSSGPIGSIFLFSKLPLETLDKKTIAVSSHSETSAVLLKIILKDFLSLNCRFRKVNSNSLKKILASFPACLLIGDQAIKAKKQLSVNSHCSLFTACLPARQVRCSLFIYDLGKLWFKYTGLPFVFALWIVRKKSLAEKERLIKKFSLDLIEVKKYASKNISLIAKKAPQRKWLSEKELVTYWKGISYDFTDKHLEGLRLFEKYAFKMHK